jgi:hypothetical protein
MGSFLDITLSNESENLYFYAPFLILLFDIGCLFGWVQKGTVRRFNVEYWKYGGDSTKSPAEQEEARKLAEKAVTDWRGSYIPCEYDWVFVTNEDACNLANALEKALQIDFTTAEYASCLDHLEKLQRLELDRFGKLEICGDDASIRSQAEQKVRELIEFCKHGEFYIG